MIAVQLAGVVKRYGFAYGLRQVDLTVGHGEIFGLFGPNASGKTTLIKIACGLLSPTRGEVRLYGKRVLPGAGDVKQMLGVLTHHSLLYDDLTVRENLGFYLEAYGFERIEERIEQVAELVEIEDRLDDRVRTLSEGLRRRADIARAIAHDPKLIALDEPFRGLDIKSTKVIEQLLVEYRRRKTILLATHLLGSLQICDQVAVMKNGKILEVVRTDELTPEVVKRAFA